MILSLFSAAETEGSGMLLKKCISAVLTAIIVSVSCFAAPFMNVSCVHEPGTGLISKCVLQCSYSSSEPGAIRLTAKTQGLAVMEKIGIKSLLISRWDSRAQDYAPYKRLDSVEVKIARYALIDNMKVELPAGDYHVTCLHFAEGATKKLGYSDQSVDNETYVRVEEDAPVPTSPPTTAITTTTKPVTTTTTAVKHNTPVTTVPGKNAGISSISGQTTAQAGSGIQANGAYNAAANSSTVQTAASGNTATTASPQTTAPQETAQPASSPRTGSPAAVPAGALAVSIAAAVAAGKRRRS